MIYSLRSLIAKWLIETANKKEPRLIDPHSDPENPADPVILSLVTVLKIAESVA